LPTDEWTKIFHTEIRFTVNREHSAYGVHGMWPLKPLLLS